MYSCVCCTQMYICYFVVENLQNVAAKKQVKKRITYLVRAELTPSLCSCVNSSSRVGYRWEIHFYSSDEIYSDFLTFDLQSHTIRELHSTGSRTSSHVYSGFTFFPPCGLCMIRLPLISILVCHLSLCALLIYFCSQLTICTVPDF